MELTLRTVENNSRNVWEDDLLRKAYYTSIKAVKEMLTMRIVSENRQDECLNSFGNQPNKSHNDHFDLGDYARATYIDGIDYEAQIISINREIGSCVIKYIGFDNEQEVDLSSLISSWGKKARRSQFTRAKKCVRSNYASNILNRNGDRNFSNEFNFETYPPSPALPPLMADGSEHLSAMLMAWYMSGYYTGVYEGQNK